VTAHPYISGCCRSAKKSSISFMSLPHHKANE
jgi:hypothetical protein